MQRTPVRSDTVGLVIFLVVAFAGGWLLCLPLFLTASPSPWLVKGIELVMMYTPALGVLIAVLVRRRRLANSAADQTEPHDRSAILPLGLQFGGSFRRCLPYLIAGLVIFVVAGLAAPFVAAAFGLVHLDLVHFSGYAEQLHATLTKAGSGAEMPPLPIWLLVIIQVGQVPVASIIPNGLATFGEEIGWRGFLLPGLLRWGQWPALVVMGVIWGLWHTPLLLLGLNYPGHHLLAIPLMIGFTTITGTILGWLRLSSGSIWPSVIAHGALNATGTSALLFRQAGTSYDPTLVGPAGLTGWILPALVIVVLVIIRRLPVRNPR